jgi:hypothetical protein
VSHPPVQRYPFRRLLLAASLLAAFPVISASAAPAATPAGGPQVSIAAVSGEHGHAFVYAQVWDARGAHPAPPGSSPTPYYSRWEAVPIGSAGCPWLWLVFVYDRATNQQLNAPPAGLPTPYLPTTTFFCPSPRVSPVAGPQLAIAQARLDLDLLVDSSPARATAGSPVTISARLDGRVSDDMGLLLSMAISDWRVDAWRFYFGDGSQGGAAGGPPRAISMTHVYPSSAVYRAAVVASISGVAQAAEYGPSGYPFLIDRAFTVQIGNDHAVPVAGASVNHVPPLLAAAVSPVIDGSGPPASTGLQRIEVPRAELVDLYLRLQIVREGYRTVGGSFTGWARSRVTGWRYMTGPGPSPDRILPDARWLQPEAPLGLQWDSPDTLAGGRPKDYAIGLQLRVAVRYPDGVAADLLVAATINVSVLYTAQND